MCFKCFADIGAYVKTIVFGVFNKFYQLLYNLLKYEYTFFKIYN